MSILSTKEEVMEYQHARSWTQSLPRLGSTRLIRKSLPQLAPKALAPWHQQTEESECKLFQLCHSLGLPTTRDLANLPT